MLLVQRKRSVPTIANEVDKQSVGNLPLDGGHVHDVVAIMDDPTLDAGPAGKFSHSDAQKVAAAFAFFQKAGANVLGVETSAPERLTAQPELHQLLAIPGNRRVPAD